MITDDDDPATILMLTAANAPTERVAGLAVDADDYLQTVPLPALALVSARSPAVSPLPSAAPCARRGSSLTKSHARQAATDDNSISRPRNLACSKRSLRQARSLSAQKIARIR
jgi:hypothetical protein